MLRKSKTGRFSHVAVLFSHNINELNQQMCRSTTGPGLSEGMHIRTHLIKSSHLHEQVNWTKNIDAKWDERKQKYNVRRQKTI